MEFGCFARANTGQQWRRAQDHQISERLVHNAEREGDTLYVPPLWYHAVVTVFADSVSANAQFSAACSILFADVTAGYLWRERVRDWVQAHHTGARHGVVSKVHRKYQKFLSPTRKVGKPKKRVPASKASKAAKARWSK